MSIVPNSDDLLKIGQIQGAGHRSPYEGEAVTTSGIVTALESNGFYLQDPEGDGEDATSDAVFVFTGAGRVTVAVGDAITITGEVQEYVPGGVETGNLSTTQLSGITDLAILSRGNPLPAATIIGAGGRRPPTEVVDDDNFTSFDPETDGIDFYEALEGMRVTIRDAVAVSPTNSFGEIFVLADNGAGATGRNDRGGITLGPDDANPERVQIQFDNDVLRNFRQDVNVGDRLGDVTGVLDYNFGNFEVKVTEAFPIVERGTLEREVTDLVGDDQRMTVATYNVLNLDPSDSEQIALLAQQIVDNLLSPDVIALQEIQDNSGTVDDGVTAADETLQALIDAIAAAGGPTYAFAEVPPEDGTSGGVPGGNIRPAYLYNPDRVELVEDSVKALSDEAFLDSRSPLEAQFRFNGQTVTVINNHLASKSGSTPIFGVEQPLIDVGAEQRLAQAEFLNGYVRALEAADPQAKVLVLGDFNDFEFSPALQALTGSGEEQVLYERLDTLIGDATYSYNFEGNSELLDHIFANGALQDRITLDIVHTNVDFVMQASDHEPIVARVDLSSESADGTFTLQILHASDLEGGVEAIGRAANFAAIVDKLEDAYEHSITLSAGDNMIPGPFFSASADPSVQAILNEVYNELYGTDVFTALAPAGGRIDISIMNVIGFDASALGNHEFDSGTSVLSDVIRGQASGELIQWIGAQFPYLSANFDFSGDGALGSLFTDEILAADSFRGDPADPASVNRPKIAPATIIEEGGELIGVVGATTQLLQQISSPGGVSVIGPVANDMGALAEILQPTIDALRDQGINKIILTSHLQQIALEQELAGLLSGVDVIIAGGSDTLLADENDVLRPGDTAAGDYPYRTTDADGNPVLIVSTDGEYSYVGRLVVEFDADGHIILDSLDDTVNGAYASTDEVVASLWGNEDPFARGTKGELVSRLVEGVEMVVTEKDGNLFGSSTVFLEGRRTEVRTEETNFGNLTADANLAEARKVDAGVMVSIKNGGGIRAPIGEIDGQTGELLPTAANPVAGKEAGQISQLDIENALRFNNALSIVTITAEGLLAAMEHAFSGVGPGATPGAFPQIAGMEVSYDPAQPAGQRVQSLAVVDDTGKPVDVIVREGELVGDAGREIKVVTLSFLAEGGDGYPFADYILDRVDLGSDNLDSGLADFAAPGTEQDALAEYLAAHYAEQPYDQAERPQEQDERIQNLAVREDTVLDGADPEPEPGQEQVGTRGDDELIGTQGDDILRGLHGDDLLDGGAGDDLLDGGYGDDILLGRAGEDELRGGHGDDLLEGGDGDDLLDGGYGDDLLLGGQGDDDLRGGYGDDRLEGGAGDDRLDGGYGDDVLIGGAGNDVLIGGMGDDTFVFAANFGKDTILDFNKLGNDTIEFGEGLFTDFDAFLAAADQVGGDVVVTLDPDNVLTLAATSLADLQQDDFRFAA